MSTSPATSTPHADGLPLSAEDTELLLFLATCAPSVHNTQPWSFQVLGDSVLVTSDPHRALPFLDPDGRQRTISCGAALHHLVVAAEGLGLQADVTLLPELSEDAIGLVRLSSGGTATQAQVARSVAILNRHTHRGRYSDAPVPARTTDVLARAAEQCSAMVRVVRPDELTEVEVLVSRAESVLQEDPAYREELSAWVWRHEQEEGRYDGLPPYAVDHGAGRAESLQGRAFDALPLPRPGTDVPAPAEHPTVLVITTDGDAPPDWVRAGTALSALLLEATARGLVAQPVGQVVDVPQTRFALQEVLGTVGVPQMVLRVGFGTTADATLRRPVRDVLVRHPR